MKKKYVIISIILSANTVFFECSSQTRFSYIRNRLNGQNIQEQSYEQLLIGPLRYNISALNNSFIIAQNYNHTFLGKICNPYDIDSIFNEEGDYGSSASFLSIWNELGYFGNKYGIYSPFNSLTSTPPMIIKDGSIIGYLTVNKSIIGGISPYSLIIYIDDFH